jgi:uncharacterized damage-inducible protein DinB
MTDATTDLRYPIGRFRFAGPSAAARRAEHISGIDDAPARLRAAVAGLTDAQLDTPYRPGGWTVRQVVHHVPDSHLNAYVRMKLCVTEDAPVIRPYDERRWADLPDGREGPAEPSLALLESLHARWVRFLRALPSETFARTLVHPESGTMTLDEVVALYDWHGRHHVAHVTALRDRMAW